MVVSIRAGLASTLAINAHGALVQLPERYHRAHGATLRRTFFNRPGQLYCTPEALIVSIDPFPEQQAVISGAFHQRN